MEIKHQTDNHRGSFYVEAGTKKIAQMVYVMAGPKRMIIEHTEVDESLRGKGIGEKLLETLVEYVRKEGLKVIPLCPFAKATFKKNEQLQDVLN